MSYASAATSERIILNFAWTGPNTWNGGSSCDGVDVRVVDLVFKDATTEVSVSLGENINPVKPQKFRFTCRKSGKETHPDSLSVTTERVRNLVLKAGVFEKGRSIGPVILSPSGEVTRQQTFTRKDRTIELEIPEKLEPGRTYSLVVSSDYECNLSALLVKEEIANRSGEKKKAAEDELLRQRQRASELLITKGLEMCKVGDLLIADGLERRKLGESLLVDGLRGMNIVSSSAPAPDLDNLSDVDLQSRFEEAVTLAKDFECQVKRAGLKDDRSELYRILPLDLANDRLVEHLTKILKARGIEPKMPQSERFKSLVIESKKLSAEE